MAGMGGGVATAQKMMGPILWVEPKVFLSIVSKASAPVICHVGSGSLSLKKAHTYLTSYKGFVFRTESKDPLSLPACDYFEVKQIQA